MEARRPSYIPTQRIKDDHILIPISPNKISEYKKLGKKYGMKNNQSERPDSTDDPKTSKANYLK
jgi:hypothetical protein